MKVFKKVLYFLLVVLVFVLIYQFNIYCMVKDRYSEFSKLKKEYDLLTEEIVFYTELKNSYEFVIKENEKLDVDRNLLKDKVSSLTNEINDLKSKIDSLNKKINNLS